MFMADLWQIYGRFMADLWQIVQSGRYGGLIESELELELDLGLFRMVLCLVYID